MKKFTTYIKNTRFAVGTTGRAVQVFNDAGKKIAEFRDLTYAYNAAFTPSGDKLIVKSTEGVLALYSLNEMQLIKKIRFGSAPQDGGFCFSIDGTRFLNVAMHEKPRRYEVKAYSPDDLSEIGTVFFSEDVGVFDIECTKTGEYYVLGNGREAFVGIVKDGMLAEKYDLTFEQSTLYIDALRLRRTGYTEECYKSTFAATGIFPGSLSLDEFAKADLTLKKLFEEKQAAK